MNDSMIIWYLVVGAVLLSVLIHMIHYLREQSRHATRRKVHLVEFAKERDMLFMPGDKYNEDEFSDDFDDIR